MKYFKICTWTKKYKNVPTKMCLQKVFPTKKSSKKYLQIGHKSPDKKCPKKRDKNFKEETVCVQEISSKIKKYAGNRKRLRHKNFRDRKIFEHLKSFSVEKKKCPPTKMFQQKNLIERLQIWNKAYLHYIHKCSQKCFNKKCQQKKTQKVQ